METSRVDGPLGLPSGTGTNSNISSLDPTVVDILRNNFGFRIGGKSLGSRSAEASGSRGSESGELSSISESVSASKSEFQSLIDKAKIEFLDRCIILAKAIISGDYGLEVAKQVLGKLIQIGRDSEPSGNLGFLKAAFSVIASPENGDNVAHNIKHLLRLSKGNITTKDIIDEFKNIGNVDYRIEFLGRLKENLRKKEKTEFKEFLEGALDGIADQIADEFNNSQSIDKNALLSKLKSVDSLRTALLAEEMVGVQSLVRLIKDDKLPGLELSIDNAKEVVSALFKCGREGLDCLADLINKGKLPDFLSEYDSSILKKTARYLLSRGPSGLAVVKALIEKNKLDLEKFNAPDAKEFALKLLEGGKPGVLLLAKLMNDNKLPGPELSIDNAKEVVNALFKCGREGLDCLADLINKGKLPDFLSEYDSSILKKTARYLLSRGPSGLAVVKALIWKGELDLEKFNAQDAKDFANALLANSLSGIDYVLELINDSSGSKLRNLESPGEVKTRAPQFRKLYSTFEREITEAFLGKTPNAGDKPWEAIRSRLEELTLREACGIWQTIANEVAASCFDENGEVDINKLKGLMILLGDEEIFKNPPYCFIPHAELMRSQMHTVCKSLLNNKSEALDLLNAANKIHVGEHGRAILDTMSKSKELTPAEAILSSLFTPHRQRYLPTCTINSLVNAEIRNHPERLIKMYGQMLEGDQFTLPSGHAIPQQEIGEGFITIDLTNGGRVRDRVFEDITSGDTDKVNKQKDRWQADGITYPGSNNSEDKYKLSLPVHNMNDILFAHFFQASNFGNRNIEDDGNLGTMLLYAGHKEYFEIHSPKIDVRGSNFSNGVAELKRYAETQQRLGNHYMRVSTKEGKLTIFGEGNYSYHSENIDIDALLALNLDSMEIGKAYPIGDRNWSWSNRSCDIPRLAIRKVGDTPPTYEFGTLYGSIFEKMDMEKFEVYTTDVKKRTPFSFGNFFKSPISSFIDIMETLLQAF